MLPIFHLTFKSKEALTILIRSENTKTGNPTEYSQLPCLSPSTPIY